MLVQSSLMCPITSERSANVFENTVRPRTGHSIGVCDRRIAATRETGVGIFKVKKKKREKRRRHYILFAGRSRLLWGMNEIIDNSCARTDVRNNKAILRFAFPFSHTRLTFLYLRSRIGGRRLTPLINGQCRAAENYTLAIFVMRVRGGTSYENDKTEKITVTTGHYAIISPDLNRKTVT